MCVRVVSGPAAMKSVEAKMCCALEYLLPCALDQGAGDRGDAQGNPRRARRTEGSTHV